MEKILVVDDELSICQVIAESLKRAGSRVTICTSAKAALEQRLEDFDLMIFDVMMPDMDGFELCRFIREKVDCPILFLTAKTTELDVIEGLAIGGDDYIRKPFRPQELVSRVKAHLRREKRVHHSVLIDGDVRFLMSAREVRINNEPIPFTKTEYNICEFMARHRGQVFSREQILERIGDYWTESEPAVVVEHIKNIRRKFAKQHIYPNQTIWGIGYKWDLGGKSCKS